MVFGGCFCDKKWPVDVFTLWAKGKRKMNEIAKHGWKLDLNLYHFRFQLEWYDTVFVNMTLEVMGESSCHFDFSLRQVQSQQRWEGEWGALNFGCATNQLCKLRLVLSVPPEEQWEGMRVRMCFWKHPKNDDSHQGLSSLLWQQAICRHFSGSESIGYPLSWRLKLRLSQPAFHGQWGKGIGINDWDVVESPWPSQSFGARTGRRNLHLQSTIASGKVYFLTRS